MGGQTQKVCGHPIAPTGCACKAEVKMNVLWILKTLALHHFILFFVPLQALAVDSTRVSPPEGAFSLKTTENTNVITDLDSPLNFCIISGFSFMTDNNCYH